MTEEQEDRAGELLAKALYLKMDPKNNNWWKTGWGTKTNIGLYRTIKSMIEDAEAGDLDRLRSN